MDQERATGFDRCGPLRRKASRIAGRASAPSALEMVACTKHFGRWIRRDRARSIADRKSTRLNSSHLGISYAVFCLKKKKKKKNKKKSYIQQYIESYARTNTKYRIT